MQTIINEALKNAEIEREMLKGIINEEDFSGQPRIVIVGCGGAGNNTVNRLHHLQVTGAETIAVNTDKQHLDMIQADKRILIGKSLTKGLGAGGYPDVGKRAAEMARSTLEGVLENVDLCFVTAGMGGGTGTGAAPVVAQIAKDQGAIVVGMVSYPFQVEKARLLRAEEGLEALSQSADSVIVLDNNRLKSYVPNLPLGQAFSVMDQLDRRDRQGDQRDDHRAVPDQHRLRRRPGHHGQGRRGRDARGRVQAAEQGRDRGPRVPLEPDARHRLPRRDRRPDPHHRRQRPDPPGGRGDRAAT